MKKSLTESGLRSKGIDMRDKIKDIEYFNTFIFTRQRYFEWLIHSDGWQSQNLLKMILFAYETVTEEAKDYASL